MTVTRLACSTPLAPLTVGGATAVKVESDSFPDHSTTERNPWRDRYLRLRQAAETIEGAVIEMLWETADLRRVLTPVQCAAVDQCREALDGLEVTLRPWLIAKTEPEVKRRKEQVCL